MFEKTVETVTCHSEGRYVERKTFMVFTGEKELHDLLKVVQWMLDFHLPQVFARTDERLKNAMKLYTSGDKEQYDRHRSMFRLFKRVTAKQLQMAYNHIELVECQKEAEAVGALLHKYHEIQYDLLRWNSLDVQHLFYMEDSSGCLKDAIRIKMRAT